VSIVVPVHDEAESLPLVHREIETAIATAGIDAEILYVDDGSRDGTPAALEEIFARDPRVSVVTLRRRFGKSAALEAGFRRANGAIVVTIDGDLQYDAADIGRLLARLGPDCDLAIGWRRTRSLSPGKKLLNVIFNAACRRAARQKIHDFNCGLRAFRREVSDEIEIYGELHRYFPVFASWRGFRLGEAEVSSRARRYGKSKFGASRILKAFFDFMAVGMLTRFSKSPLHVFGLLGVLLTALGFLVNGYLSVLWCFGSSIGSRPLLLFGVLLMIIGVQTTFFGLLAELIVNARRGEGEYAIDSVLAHGTAEEKAAAVDNALRDRDEDGTKENTVHA
jgi:glycosyltransferase involved in cell wall biosynthesis